MSRDFVAEWKSKVKVINSQTTTPAQVAPIEPVVEVPTLPRETEASYDEALYTIFKIVPSGNRKAILFNIPRLGVLPLLEQVLQPKLVRLSESEDEGTFDSEFTKFEAVSNSDKRVITAEYKGDSSSRPDEPKWVD